MVKTHQGQWLLVLQLSTFNFFLWKQYSDVLWGEKKKTLFVLLSSSIGLGTLSYDWGLSDEYIKTPDMLQVSRSKLVSAFC